MDRKEPLWQENSRKYQTYLTIERNFADNSVESYMRDLRQFVEYAVERGINSPKDVTVSDINNFMACVYDKGVKKSSQARVLSGVKSFFNYLVANNLVDSSPVEFIESPKLTRSLPEVLSIDDIDKIIDNIDTNHPQGFRNKAIIETIYSCGIRASELISLTMNDVFFNDGFIRVNGKGRKQRIVPISDRAIEYIKEYMNQRNTMTPSSKHQDCLFLNRRGNQLTRVMIHTIISRAAKYAGITKSVGPHTLRHSFATHLLVGGANIRQVQDLLGHESVVTTEIYTHLDITNLADSLEKHHPLKL